MEFAYTISERDVLEARRAQLNWSGRALPFIGGLLILCGVFLLIQNPRNFGLPVAATCIGTVFILRVRLLASISYRRDKGLHDRFVTVASDERIETSCSTGSTTSTWNAFTRQRETAGLFLLYRGAACVNIIPKNGLSADEADSFRKLIRSKINGGDEMQRKGSSIRTWIFIVVVVVSFCLLLLTIRNTLRQSSPGAAPTHSTN